MNEAGRQAEPFLFIIDFEMQNCIFCRLSEAGNNIYYSTGNHNHLPENTVFHKKFKFDKHPVDFNTYEQAFEKVCDKIKRGYTYLTNLTFPTKLSTDLSLEEIFMRSISAYKILVPGKFVSFSPECFVKIEDCRIFSFPMKGTIDANIPDAENKILADPKETAEHYIIVDLIRNDLSQVATEVIVNRFRFIDKIVTNDKTLLQVSSSIRGVLPANYLPHLGDIIFSLLPAGSVSGAPKPSTLNIIREVEQSNRNYYTGIWGIFDGKDLDSAVLIRYIEQSDTGLIFHSGGGITSQSNAESEYKELIDKVYVPFN